ncbi:hypothetical protein [Vibrio anguillarum]|uniref:hypothetical protein n=1 Tax=Vibrio anguillarum TaxID=55601 RepID=UPI001E35620B|nr:hypothetical protein [Vibrio anguillarum]
MTDIFNESTQHRESVAELSELGHYDGQDQTIESLANEIVYIYCPDEDASKIHAVLSRHPIHYLRKPHEHHRPVRLSRTLLR